MKGLHFLMLRVACRGNERKLQHQQIDIEVNFLISSVCSLNMKLDNDSSIKPSSWVMNWTRNCLLKVCLRGCDKRSRRNMKNVDEF